MRRSRCRRVARRSTQSSSTASGSRASSPRTPCVPGSAKYRESTWRTTRPPRTPDPRARFRSHGSTAASWSTADDFSELGAGTRAAARAQLLTARAVGRWSRSCAQVGGIHAQVQASAELQLAARVDGITQADVRDALWRDRTLVKAWTLRGTLHLHPADEVCRSGWRPVGPSPREPKELPAWPDPKGMRAPAGRAPRSSRKSRRRSGTPSTASRCSARSWRREGRPPRRKEARRASAVGLRRSSPASSCQGPPQGNKITLARPDQWIEGWQRRSTRRMRFARSAGAFCAHIGPARPADFETGSATPDSTSSMSRRSRWKAVPPSCSQETRRSRRKPRSVRLLPEYDVYVMGFREREQLVPATRARTGRGARPRPLRRPGRRPLPARRRRGGGALDAGRSWRSASR